MVGVSFATNLTTLAGYWKFDSGPAQNMMGKNSAGPTSYNCWGGASYGVGLVGTSFHSDGTGWIQYGGPYWGGYQDILTLPAFALDFWFKGDLANGFMSNEQVLFHGQAAGYAQPMGFDISGNGNTIAIGSADQWLVTHPGIQYIHDTFGDTWAHVFVKFDVPAGIQTLTINNVLIGSGPLTAATVGPENYFAIGSVTWGAYGMRGDLDEFKIWTPEPTTIALLGLGGLFLRRRKTA